MSHSQCTRVGRLTCTPLRLSQGLGDVLPLKAGHKSASAMTGWQRLSCLLTENKQMLSHAKCADPCVFALGVQNSRQHHTCYYSLQRYTMVKACCSNVYQKPIECQTVPQQSLITLIKALVHHSGSLNVFETQSKDAGFRS